MFDQQDMNQLYRYCYSFTVNDAAAYDLLQTALEKFLKSKTLKQYNRAFLYKIIRNQFIDDQRKACQWNVDSYNELNHVDIDVKTLESIIIDDDLIEHLLQYLQPLEREILFYWALEGYSTQQIADMMKIPKGTILSKIYRMRLRIQEQFSEADLNLTNEEAKS